MPTSTQPPTIDELPGPESFARVNGASGTPQNGAWHQWMMMALGLTALLTVVAIAASVISLSSKTATTTTIIRQGGRSTSAAGTGAGGATMHMGGTGGMSGHMGATGSGASAAALGSGEAQSGAAAVVPIVLQLDSPTGLAGTVTGKDGWPLFAPSKLTVPAGKKVTLVITNYDDVSTPLQSGVPYNRVQGGTETVNGKPVTYVGNKTIAHTFTVTGLGLNVPIPMAPHAGSVTVTYTFVAHKAGTYIWQCFTPCGSGKNGTEGPMMKQGFMQGTVTAVA